MRYGLTMFATDLSMDPVELARAAEARGFASLWLPEHTHIPVSRRTPPPTGRGGVGDVEPAVGHGDPAAGPARADRHRQGGGHAGPPVGRAGGPGRRLRL